MGVGAGLPDVSAHMTCVGGHMTGWSQQWVWPAIGKEPPHTTVHPGTFNGMDTTEVASFPGLCPAGGRAWERGYHCGRQNKLFAAVYCSLHTTN